MMSAKGRHTADKTPPQRPLAPRWAQLLLSAAAGIVVQRIGALGMDGTLGGGLLATFPWVLLPPLASGLLGAVLELGRPCYRVQPVISFTIAFGAPYTILFLLSPPVALLAGFTCAAGTHAYGRRPEPYPVIAAALGSAFLLLAFGVVLPPPVDAPGPMHMHAQPLLIDAYAAWSGVSAFLSIELMSDLFDHGPT